MGRLPPPRMWPAHRPRLPRLQARRSEMNRSWGSNHSLRGHFSNPITSLCSNKLLVVMILHEKVRLFSPKRISADRRWILFKSFVALLIFSHDFAFLTCLTYFYFSWQAIE